MWGGANVPCRRWNLLAQDPALPFFIGLFSVFGKGPSPLAKPPSSAGRNTVDPALERRFFSHDKRDAPWPIRLCAKAQQIPPAVQIGDFERKIANGTGLARTNVQDAVP